VVQTGSSLTGHPLPSLLKADLGRHFRQRLACCLFACLPVCQ
jgi:hypothetical protein